MKINVEVPQFIKPALYNDYKYSIIVAGRRTGKTYNAIQWLLETLMTTDATSAIHIDTTQGNIQKYVDRYYKKFLKPIWHLCSWNSQKYILTLPGGKYIDFGSAERPENLEGFDYDLALLNEGGHILKKDTFWYNTLQPMFKQAIVRIIGTPKSKNLFHNLYELGKSGSDSDYTSFHFTAYDSPFWKKEQLEKIKKNIPEEFFRQEYLAEFLEGAGSVFRSIHECIREPEQGLKANVMAVDLAKHQDFTVITLANKEQKQVIEMDRFNQIDWGFQKDRIVNTWEKNGKPKLVIDSTGAGDPIFDDLKNHGVQVEGYKFTNKTKNELIKSLSVAMDNRDINFPNINYLVSELEVFGYDMTPSGNIRYNAPSGHHDDAVISLALANYLIQNSVNVSLSWID